jgi:hypothetical protein
MMAPLKRTRREAHFYEIFFTYSYLSYPRVSPCPYEFHIRRFKYGFLVAVQFFGMGETSLNIQGYSTQGY